jgi:hypothetical protein
MPTMANMTVKKADGTTDIVYTVVQPSAGSSQPAVWRAPGGGAPAFQPELRVRAQGNQAGTTRRVEATISYPEYYVDANGLTKVNNRALLTMACVVPTGMASTAVSEAVHQGLNLFAHALMKSSGIEGYSPS